ncbi:SPX domain-containing protein 3-like [Hibiscus syriacus]|uniref:SPX domain-containing protein 3-like n=1 Tax=Hibiscus syriacus TaxID=106335 RepID=A0A6A2XUV7_HIBSY|nr:uncharacterized protein DDB_G0283697-like [Hibiscus syriacus]KAE8665786.1 SPX domain-containing protein 3-like [Hibiscus syriacus]
MSKREISNSVSDESESQIEENLSEEKEEDDEVILEQEQQGISEYEKQRLSRIAENRARMEALGLTKIASSLMGLCPNSSRPSSKIKGKRKVIDDDEDYRLNDDEDDKDDYDDENDDDNLDDDDYVEFSGRKTPRAQSRKSKVKCKGSKPKKKVDVKKQLNSSDYVDNDDELMKAIALSLKDSGEVLGTVSTDVQDATSTERKGNARSKRKKSFTSRTQMTEDEMVVHFFQFDEAGKGSISTRDLRSVAIAHDFIWTEKELTDMIHCFDTDGDGKLNLDDFRKIVTRCNMLQTSENP